MNKPWFYIVPYDQETNKEYCGTGGYYERLSEVIAFAATYDKRKIRHSKHLLQCKILNVDHELIVVIGIKFNLSKVRISNGYDSDGCYWGSGAPLYRYDDGGQISDYIRADGRDHAKAQLINKYPHAQFSRP